MIKTITILSTLLFLYTSALATEYYVNPDNGNDRNEGKSVSSAFRSLSKIERINLEPGDIVYLMNGTYERSGGKILVIKESGNEDNWITIRNFPGHSPLLKFDGWTGIDLINGASYIALSGLRIQGAREKVTLEEALNQPGSCENDQQGGAQGLYNGTGILAVGPNLRWSNSSTTGDEIPHHILVENCEIFDCTSSGLAFQQSDYVTIRNNKIYNNAWYTLYGTSGLNFYQFVNIDDSPGIHNVVTNNLMYGNEIKVPQIPYCQFWDGNAFIVDDFNHTQTSNYKDPERIFPAYTAQTLVKNNVIVENGGSGLHFFLSSNCLIYNNTVINNAFQNQGVNGNAELRVGSCSNFDIKNNIFKGAFHINNVGGNTNISYAYNYQEGPDIFFEFADCEGCIYEGLQLQNTDIGASNPFITPAESPVKDSGVSIEQVSDDYLLNIRDDNDPYDIGAYELGRCSAITWYVDNDNDGFGSETDVITSCEQPDGYVSVAGDECDEDPETTEKTIWYADADNDGVGSSTIFLESCVQPEGYVSTSGDDCDMDANKTDPGECGCNVEEGTCEPSSENCTAPSYNSATTYANAGTVVTYQGKAYRNKWYAKNDLPTNGGPWELIEVCDGSGEDCSSFAAWDSKEIYRTSGTKITFEDKIYQNKWYSKNDIPGESQVWEFVNTCQTATPALKNHAPQRSTLSDMFNIYPVLFNEYLTVVSPQRATIFIYGASGQLVLTKELFPGTDNIDTTQLGSGIFFIQIDSEKITDIKKVIKI